MKIIRNVLIIVLALLLQSTLLVRFSFWDIKPDLAMMVLLFLVSSSGQMESVLYGFLIGFIQDVYSPEALGINSFTMSLIGFSLDICKERFAVENYSVKIVVAFIACIVHDIIFLSFYTKFDSVILLKLFIRQSLPGAVYTSCLLIIIVMVWQRLLNGGFDFIVQGLFGYRR
jgi:rod shape-determining protein MreD